MPVVNYKKYVAMLEKAHKEAYAYPAINVTTTDTMNAAIEWDLRSFIEPTNVNLLKTALSLISQVLENRKKVLS